MAKLDADTLSDLREKNDVAILTEKPRRSLPRRLQHSQRIATRAGYSYSYSDEQR